MSDLFREVVFDPDATLQLALSRGEMQAVSEQANMFLAQHTETIRVMTQTAMRLNQVPQPIASRRTALNRAFMDGCKFALFAASLSAPHMTQSDFESDIVGNFVHIPDLYATDVLPRDRINIAEIVLYETASQYQDVSQLLDALEFGYEQPTHMNMRDDVARFAMYGASVTADRLIAIEQMTIAPSRDDFNDQLAKLLG